MRRFFAPFFASAVACSFPRPADLSYDAAPSDSGIVDATLADAGRGLVNVTVMDLKGSGTPAPFIPVVFVDPDGTPVTTVMTDSNGKASASLLAGGSATAVFAASATMESVLGVKPGDDLIIGTTTLAPDMTAGKFTVHFPVCPDATVVVVYGPCALVGSTPTDTSAVIKVSHFCADPPTAFVEAFKNGTPVCYIEKSNLLVTDGGNAYLTDFAPYISIDTQITNIAADVGAAGAVRHATKLHSTGIVDLTTGAVANGKVTGSAQAPSCATAVVQTGFRRASDSDAVQSTYERVSGTKTEYIFDASAHRIPWVTVPILDVTTGRVTGTGSGPGSGDAYRARIQYKRTVGSASTEFTWIVVAERPSEIALPRIPAEVGDMNPRAGDANTYSSAIYVDDGDLAGYDQARGHAFDLFDAWLQGRPGSTPLGGSYKSSNGVLQ